MFFLPTAANLRAGKVSSLIHPNSAVNLVPPVTLLFFIMETGVLCVVKGVRTLFNWLEMLPFCKTPHGMPRERPCSCSHPFSKGCCVSTPYHLALGKVCSSLCKGWPWKRRQPQSSCERDTVKTPSSIIIEIVKTNQIAKELPLSKWEGRGEVLNFLCSWEGSDKALNLILINFILKEKGNLIDIYLHIEIGDYTVVEIQFLASLPNFYLSGPLGYFRDKKWE